MPVCMEEVEDEVMAVEEEVAMKNQTNNHKDQEDMETMALDSGRRRERSNIQCHNCHKYGHYALKCWSAPNN